MLVSRLNTLLGMLNFRVATAFVGRGVYTGSFICSSAQLSYSFPECHVINRIEQWIKETNRLHQPSRRACSVFEKKFEGFYSPGFLRSAFFVIVDELPKPDLPELRQMGFGDFLDMPAVGITYMDTYYVTRPHADNLRLHFHELVHVAQWGALGAANFIMRYVFEIQTHGYQRAPLEVMAYTLDRHYASGGERLDVPHYVQSKLELASTL